MVPDRISAPSEILVLPNGNHRITCPECSMERKKKHEKCLSVSVDFPTWKWFCHNCNWAGAYRPREERFQLMTPPSVPEPFLSLVEDPVDSPETPTLSDNAAGWLAKRGISVATAQRAGVFSGEYGFPGHGRREGVWFPYINDKGETYAHKIRTGETKLFVQAGGANTFWRSDQVEKEKDLYLVEGECFPGSAEVLTPTGWQRLDQYDGSPALQVHAVSGVGEFVKPLARVRRPFSGDLVRHEVKGWVSVTTPNHKLIRVVSDGRWVTHEAWDTRRHGRIPRTAEVDGPGIGLTTDQIMLSIAVSADASIRDLSGTPGVKPRSGRPPRERRYAVMAFIKQRKVDRLVALLTRLGMEFSFNDTTSNSGHTMINFSIPDWVPGRMLPWSWVANATRAERELILSEMVLWDGNSVPNRNQTEYSSKHYDNVSWMQAMAHTTGRCSSIIPRTNEFGSWYKASILHGKSVSSWQTVRTSAVPHSDDVFCLTMPSGFLLVRQEGKVTVSGNCDALSLMEVGEDNCVSVPNGAPVKVSDGKILPEEDRRFKYVWSGKDMLDNAKRVIIAVDNDEPGRALGEELARRIGKARCWRIVWPEGCKDANDVLVKLGPDKLRDLLSKPEPWPIAGVYAASHYEAGVRALFKGGLGKGLSTGFPALDDLYTVVPGHLCMITGVPGAGKSTWLNAVMVNMVRQHGWRFAIWSTENTPEVLISMLAALKVEKPFFGEGDGPRITEAELDEALEWVNEHFVFLTGDGGATTSESVIDRLKTAVLRYGVRGAIIDPASYLARPPKDGDGGGSDSVGHMLEAFKNFAVSHDVACWLVAHPYKMRQNLDGSSSVPKGYEISGCYDDKTEVLTTDGWVPHHQVTLDHEVMCFDPDKNQTFYARPSEAHVYDHDGPMHHYKGNNLDLMVTPNHRMVVRPNWETPFTRGLTKRQAPSILPRDRWSVLRSDEMASALWMLPMSAPFGGSASPEERMIVGSESYSSQDFWWFTGFWAAEGCVQTVGLSVCQAEDNSAKPVEVMERLGLDRSEKVTHLRKEEKPLWASRIKARSHPDLCRWMAKEVGEGCSNKRIPAELWSRSAEDKAAFLAGMVFGDGNRTASAYRICLTSRGMVDDLQRLAYELGMWAHARADVRGPSMKDHHMDRWTVTIRTDVVERGIQCSLHKKTVQYVGKVYCLTVPGGAYVTRRNGRAMICGNSASYYNRPDFGLTIHRPPDARHVTEVHVWKVRYSWTGAEGKTDLFHDRDTGRYSDNPFPVTLRYATSCFPTGPLADPWDGI